MTNIFRNYAFITIFILVIGCKNNQNSTEGAKESDMVELVNWKISLAEWSFHKALQSGEMTHLDFILKAGSMGFDGVEYVNQFFKDKVRDTSYLNQMIQVAKTANVQQLLIMIDGEGYLGDLNTAVRDEAVNNHYKWVDAAAYLGCHSIRVNAHGVGTAEEVSAAAIDGLTKLATYASTKGINVLVENHGGYSSNGEWLANVMKKIDKPNCGTLPDFGNFCLKRENDEMWNTQCIEEYDRYKGVEELMPYAKAVSAKSYDFGELGFETTIDYFRMLGIVKSLGYNGFIGVEYEGNTLSEEDGIKATKLLLEKCLMPIK